MPGSPVVSKPLLGLARRVERSMRNVPERSLLTKKTAPPPSRARLSLDQGAAQPESELVAVQVRSRRRFPRPWSRGAPGWHHEPTARLSRKTLLSTTHETPMLLIARAVNAYVTVAQYAFEPAARRRRTGRSIGTGRRTRSAAPPTSRAVVSGTGCRGKVEFDDLEDDPPRTNTAPPPMLVVGSLPRLKGEVLDDEPRGGLVVAVRGRPDLRPVTGVLVQDPALASPVERGRVRHRRARPACWC